MKKWNEAGFTRNELIAVVGVVAILALVLYPAVHSQIDQAACTSMKSRGRGIWCCVLEANAEREPLGLSAVWAKDLGFDASKTSTEYFRLLMSDSPTGKTNEPNRSMCEDLKLSALSGAGVPCADAPSVFSSKNNAWTVICVSTQTPSEAAFLITRNVEIGRKVNALSPLKLSDESPLRIRRCVYLTCGGACIDRREGYLNTPSGLSAVLEGMGTNTTYDVMYP